MGRWLVLFFFLWTSCLAGQVKFNPEDPDFIRFSGTPMATVHTTSANALKDKAARKVYIQQEPLDKFMARIGKFPQLEILFLVNNQLQRLGADIGQCQSMFAFSSRKNPILELPASFFSLASLLYLELNDTRLAEIPVDMAALHRLELWRMAGTQTDTLRFNDTMPGLSRLRVFQMYDTPLCHFPQFLLSCKELEEITLVNCQLSSLPDSLFLLPKLRRINVSENQIAAIPSSWGRCPNLQVIEAAENKLETLPESLFHLKGLSYLDVQKNPIDEQTKEVFRILLSKKANFKFGD
jgi:leucine-rich repeat protein SHOC2